MVRYRSVPFTYTQQLLPSVRSSFDIPLGLGFRKSLDYINIRTQLTKVEPIELKIFLNNDYIYSEKFLKAGFIFTGVHRTLDGKSLFWDKGARLNAYNDYLKIYYNTEGITTYNMIVVDLVIVRV